MPGVAVLPFEEYNPETLVAYLAPVIGSWDFFLFFGFGNEAMAPYRTAFAWFTRTILPDSSLPTFRYQDLLANEIA
jgi:hypothetical protein